MTKTYSDPEMMVALLREKEADLELAARIGQSLLEENKQQRIRNEDLEERVHSLTEQVSQLRHEASMKTDLIRVLNQQMNSDSVEDLTSLYAVKPKDDEGRKDGEASKAKVDNLQKKIEQLQQENEKLKSTASSIELAEEEAEARESALVDDVVRQLRESDRRNAQLLQKLQLKTEECLHQQQDITSMLSQMCDSSNELKRQALEKEELQLHLLAARETQRELTQELGELRQDHTVAVEMLDESRKNVKNLERKLSPKVVVESSAKDSLLAASPTRFAGFDAGFRFLGGGATLAPLSVGAGPASLAMELESTLLASAEPEITRFQENLRHQNRRVFETVKAASKALKQVEKSQRRELLKSRGEDDDYEDDDENERENDDIDDRGGGGDGFSKTDSETSSNCSSHWRRQERRQQRRSGERQRLPRPGGRRSNAAYLTQTASESAPTTTGVNLLPLPPLPPPPRDSGMGSSFHEGNLTIPLTANADIFVDDARVARTDVDGGEGFRRTPLADVDYADRRQHESLDSNCCSNFDNFEPLPTTTTTNLSASSISSPTSVDTRVSTTSSKHSAAFPSTSSKISSSSTSLFAATPSISSTTVSATTSSSTLLDASSRSSIRIGRDATEVSKPDAVFDETGIIGGCAVDAKSSGELCPPLPRSAGDGSSSQASPDAKAKDAIPKRPLNLNYLPRSVQKVLAKRQRNEYNCDKNVYKTEPKAPQPSARPPPTPSTALPAVPGRPGVPGSTDLDAAIARIRRLRRAAREHGFAVAKTPSAKHPLDPPFGVHPRPSRRSASSSSSLPSRPRPPASSSRLDDDSDASAAGGEAWNEVPRRRDRSPSGFDETDGAEEEDLYSSTSGGRMSLDSLSMFRPALPERLEIVKPLRGSVTLQTWRQLARPSFDLLQSRPPEYKGVRYRAQILNPELAQFARNDFNGDSSRLFSLSDFEEDDDETDDFFVGLTSSNVAVTSSSSASILGFQESFSASLNSILGFQESFSASLNSAGSAMTSTATDSRVTHLRGADNFDRKMASFVEANDAVSQQRVGSVSTTTTTTTPAAGRSAGRRPAGLCATYSFNEDVAQLARATETSGAGGGSVARGRCGSPSTGAGIGGGVGGGPTFRTGSDGSSITPPWPTETRPRPSTPATPPSSPTRPFTPPSSPERRAASPIGDRPQHFGLLDALSFLPYLGIWRKEEERKKFDCAASLASSNASSTASSHLPHLSNLANHAAQPDNVKAPGVAGDVKVSSDPASDRPSSKESDNAVRCREEPTRGDDEDDDRDDPGSKGNKWQGRQRPGIITGGIKNETEEEDDDDDDAGDNDATTPGDERKERGSEDGGGGGECGRVGDAGGGDGGSGDVVGPMSQLSGRDSLFTRRWAPLAGSPGTVRRQSMPQPQPPKPPPG